MDELHAFQRENLDFHEIVEHVDHSIFVTDGEGNVLYVNPAYSQNTTSSRRMFWAETYLISCRRQNLHRGCQLRCHSEPEASLSALHNL